MFYKQIHGEFVLLHLVLTYTYPCLHFISFRPPTCFDAAAADDMLQQRYLALASTPGAIEPSAEAPAAADGAATSAAAKLFDRHGVVASATVQVEAAKTTFAPSTNLGNLDPARHTGGSSSKVDGSGTGTKWVTRGFILCDKALKFRTVSEVRLSLQLKPSAKAHCGKTVRFILGQIQMTRVSALARVPTTVPNLSFSRARWREVEHEGVWRLGGLLEWGGVGDAVDAPEHFDIWAADGAGGEDGEDGQDGGDGARFVCRVHGYTARPRVVVKPSVSKVLRLFVQPVTAAGIKPAVSECASIMLTF